MAISMADIKSLRQRTGAGILDCKKALAETNGDVDQAIDWLRAKGIAKAAKKASRAATEGLVFSYIHDGGRIGVLVEVNCETDFVARNDNFAELCEDIAMHIAASAPDYVSKDEVDPNAAERERQVQLERIKEEGDKPAKMPQDRWDAIIEKKIDGRMRKWYESVCLLEQPFIKDDSKTVAQMLADSVSTIGENIQVRRFARYVLGEGLEKKQDNLADEVAKLTAEANA
jgi:elongation factor Ts